MSDVLLTYEVIEVDSLNCRIKPTLKCSVIKYLHNGDRIKIVKGWSKKVDDITWFKTKLDDGYGYVSSKYLKRITPNYRARVAKYADEVYAEIIKLGCRHKYGAKKRSELQKKKITTCATAVSIVLQESGMMNIGNLINHTKSVSNPLKKKTTINKTISGRKNIKNGTYTIKKMGKTFSSLPSAYKKKGAIYFYDSNVAIYAGDNYIYSCNNAPSQLKNSKYIKNKMKSGYCFTAPILYVILPND